MDMADISEQPLKTKALIVAAYQPGEEAKFIKIPRDAKIGPFALE